MLDVIYQGEGAAMPDLIGGRMQAMFGVMPASLGYHQIRQAARAGGDQREAPGTFAGRSGHGGISAGL